jgi:hypothetical protein
MNYSKYHHLAIEGAKPPPSKAQICAIEDELGAKLPPSFLQYLAVANGGYLEYSIEVPTGSGKSEDLSFCGLFSADIGTFCDETFVGEIRSGRQFAKLPVGVLPFARDGGGSMVYLDLTTAGNGRVVAFVKGLPGWTGLRTDSAFIELATSFDEYVGKLKIDLDAVIDHLKYDATELSHIASTEEWLDIGLPNWRSNTLLVSTIREAKERIEYKE